MVGSRRAAAMVVGAGDGAGVGAKSGLWAARQCRSTLAPQLWSSGPRRHWRRGLPPARIAPPPAARCACRPAARHARRPARTSRRIRRRGHRACPCYPHRRQWAAERWLAAGTAPTVRRRARGVVGGPRPTLRRPRPRPGPQPQPHPDHAPQPLSPRPPGPHSYPSPTPRRAGAAVAARVGRARRRRPRRWRRRAAPARPPCRPGGGLGLFLRPLRRRGGGDEGRGRRRVWRGRAERGRRPGLGRCRPPAAVLRARPGHPRPGHRSAGHLRRPRSRRPRGWRRGGRRCAQRRGQPSRHRRCPLPRGRPHGRRAGGGRLP